MEDYLLSFYLHHHIYIKIERNNILGNIQKSIFISQIIFKKQSEKF